MFFPAIVSVYYRPGCRNPYVLLIVFGMDKYNKKIMIVTIRDPDLFWVEN
jgi:hypothetical protein